MFIAEMSDGIARKIFLITFAGFPAIYRYIERVGFLGQEPNKNL